MRRIELCPIKDCGRWRLRGQKWQESQHFHMEEQETIGWRRIPCDRHLKGDQMTGTSEPLRDEETKPIVMICLKEGCDMTSWHGLDHWEISIDRSDGILSGKYTPMMGPGGACSDHRGNLMKKGA